MNTVVANYEVGQFPKCEPHWHVLPSDVEVEKTIENFIKDILEHGGVQSSGHFEIGTYENSINIAMDNNNEYFRINFTPDTNIVSIAFSGHSGEISMRYTTLDKYIPDIINLKHHIDRGHIIDCMRSANKMAGFERNRTLDALLV